MSKHAGPVASITPATAGEEHEPSLKTETNAVQVLPIGALHAQEVHERVSVIPL
jgi:hypothetical protein